jgi:hypothetical protein NreA
MVSIMGSHQSHSDIVKRLKRSKGHLEKVIRMIEEECPCLDVAQQLQAVTNAVANAKHIYVQDHIEHCIEDALADENTDKKVKISEFKEITKYL